MMNVSIRTKIVAPFLVLFAVEFAVAAVLASSVAGRSVERSIRRESADLSRILSQAGFAPDRALLGKIKAIAGSDLARLEAGGGGGGFISTLNSSDEGALRREVERLFGGAGPANGEAGEFVMGLDSGTCKVFYSPVEAAGGKSRPSLMLIMPESRVAEAKSELARPILLAAGAGALVVALLGIVLATAITRPITELAAASARIASGALDERVAVAGGDEIARLAASFNVMAEELGKRQAELLKSERLAVSGRLATGVAHEIRNPLTAVRMSLQRAARDGGTVDSETAGVLLSEVRRVEMIVDGLVAYGRPGNPELTPTDVAALVEDVMVLMKRQLEHSHVETKLELPDGGLIITADGSKLRQVVMDLVLNGAGAMPGGGSLTVSVSSDEDGAVITVADTGGGVAEDIRDRIYEPFVSGTEDGTGLGLAVTRQIVEEHSGRIDYETSPSGTIFTVRIPDGAGGG